MLDFASDNAAGVSAPILDALRGANLGTAPAYGEDAWTERAHRRLEDVFETRLSMFLVATGTAANALALGALCPSFGAAFCHVNAHVAEDECGAPEMFTAGAKLVGVAGGAGKIAPQALAATLKAFPRGPVKQAQPAALSLSQATEAGTAYDPDEIARLAGMAHAAGLGVHMDGARFANALVELGVSPADMSWRAGVDILSFGATKNGALACEAVLVFDPARATTLPFQRKRSGHTLSKGRFLGAQMLAYLEDGHWLDNAHAANARAARLHDGLAAARLNLPWPRQANEVFALLPARVDAGLRAAGARYYDWSDRDYGEGRRADEVFARFVTSFATTEPEVDALLSLVRDAAAQPEGS
ncbi:threonine aldolase family protein [Methylocella sp.]|uniref:threonine aldolase family protein n=1 Tax=Methylocella sp. TaxID=1978226 RepID=UPI0037852EB7